MASPKGIASIAHLQRRALDQRGGQSAQVDSWDRSKPDALALWRDAYLDQLAARNYSEGTLEGRRDALKVFLIWAAERELTQAGQITRPILEAYQRWLWRYTKADGKRLGWSTQRSRIGTLKDWFGWMTKQNVVLHNPASELELPRMEKRLPEAALTLSQTAALLAVPNTGDALGMRDRAVLELDRVASIRVVPVGGARLQRRAPDASRPQRQREEGSHGAGRGTGRAVGGKIPRPGAAPVMPRHPHPGVVPDWLRRPV
jgi:hypothetical protein